MSERPALSRVRKLTYGVIALILVLGSFELILIPFVHPPRTFNCRSEPGGRVCVFNGNRYHQPIATPKPAGTYRVMVFGESAVDGWLEKGFPAWLEDFVRAGRPDRNVEIINLGLTGSSTTMIAGWFDQALDLQPDLVILYLGNNDLDRYSDDNPLTEPVRFKLLQGLQRSSRIYHLVVGLAAILSRPEAHDPEAETARLFARTSGPQTDRRKSQAAELYRSNLETMTRAARARGAEVILVSPAANLRDWPPLNDEPAPELSAKKRETIKQQLEAARAALAHGDSAAARAALEEVLRLEPRHAQAHFLRGKVEELEGRFNEAYADYQQARDLDASLLRAPSGFARINAEVAAANGARFLDLDQILKSRVPSGIPGFDLYFDYLHFNSRGNYEVASILFREFKKTCPLKWGDSQVPLYEPARARLYSNAELEIDRILEGAFLTRFGRNPTIAEQAARTFGQAALLAPRDPLPLLYQALLAAQSGDGGKTREILERALVLSSDRASQMARRFFPRALEIYQGQAVIRLDEARSWAGLSNAETAWGWSPPNLPALDFGTTPLESADYIFRWDSKTARLTDVTAVVQVLLKDWKAEAPAAGVNLLADPTRIGFHALTPGPAAGVFETTSPDSYLIVKRLSVDPLSGPVLTVEAALTTEEPGENMAELFWTTADQPDFSEARKLSFSLPADGEVRSIEVPLGQIVSILEGGPVTSLRLDLSSRPARIELRRLELSFRPARP